MTTYTSSFAAPAIKLTALAIVLGLHLFHPAGQAAALPLSLLVLGGAWLAEASLLGAGNWTSMGMAMIGAGTMPFYLGVLVFNAVVTTHLPPPIPLTTGKSNPVYVSASKSSPVPSGPQGGCGSGCGGSAGGCGAGGSSGGGCGSAAGGCGSGCGGSAKPQRSIANTQAPEVRTQMAAQMAAVANAKGTPPPLATPVTNLPPLAAAAVQRAQATVGAPPANAPIPVKLANPAPTVVPVASPLTPAAPAPATPPTTAPAPVVSSPPAVPAPAPPVTTSAAPEAPASAKPQL